MEVCNFKKSEQIFQKKDGFISFLFGWALVTMVFLVILLFQFISFSTPSEIKQLKGRGTVQSYDFPYGEVFQVTAYLMNEKGLAIIESNEKEGYIIVAEESDFFYKGRIIALFFESSKNHTQVEVISRFMALPPLKELILPRNRPSQILNDIGKRLESNNKGEN